MASSIYKIAVATTDTPISDGGNILSTPITITAAQVTPGGGGILRIYFSFAFGSGTETIINVFGGSTTTLKGALNADNNGVLENNGYYRFDIDVEAGDVINLKPSGNSIETINFFRAHLVLFGA